MADNGLLKRKAPLVTPSLDRGRADLPVAGAAAARASGLRSPGGGRRAAVTGRRAGRRAPRGPRARSAGHVRPVQHVPQRLGVGDVEGLGFTGGDGFHSAALAYLSDKDRTAAAAAITGSGARWISFESRDVVALAADLPGAVTLDTAFVAALDRVPFALASGHADVTLL